MPSTSRTGSKKRPCSVSSLSAASWSSCSRAQHDLGPVGGPSEVGVVGPVGQVADHEREVEGDRSAGEPPDELGGQVVAFGAGDVVGGQAGVAQAGSPRASAWP